MIKMTKDFLIIERFRDGDRMFRYMGVLPERTRKSKSCLDPEFRRFAELSSLSIASLWVSHDLSQMAVAFRFITESTVLHSKIYSMFVTNIFRQSRA